MKSESHVLNSILSLSNGRDLVLFRQQSGNFYTRDGRLVRIGIPGIPDIFGEFRGKAVWIECKNERGTLRPDQRVFITAALSRGCMAFCARTPEHVLRMLNGPTGWQDWEIAAQVQHPVYEWGPAKFYRQTGNESPTNAEYFSWLLEISGL